MAGQDHLLSKAFLATGASAYILGQVVVAAAGTTLDPNQVVQATTGAGAANQFTPVGVAAENLDLVKVQTAKAYISIVIAGSAFVIWDGVGTLNPGTPLIPSASVAGRVAATTPGSFTTGGRPCVGIWLGYDGASPAAGDLILALLTPGARV
jgi:hypothetical protein